MSCSPGPARRHQAKCEAISSLENVHHSLSAWRPVRAILAGVVGLCAIVTFLGFARHAAHGAYGRIHCWPSRCNLGPVNALFGAIIPSSSAKPSSQINAWLVSCIKDLLVGSTWRILMSGAVDTVEGMNCCSPQPGTCNQDLRWRLALLPEKRYRQPGSAVAHCKQQERRDGSQGAPVCNRHP